jgi:uncharacterized membrane protein
MDIELVTLRLLHIVPGAFWVGGALVMAFIFEPAIRGLDPAPRGALMRRLGATFTPAVAAAAGLTIVFGFVLVARTPGRAFGDLFTTPWGWAIGLGMVAALIGLAAGSMTGATARRMGALVPAGGPPSMEAMQQIGGLLGRLRMLGRINAVFALIALATMAVARFV